VKKAIPLFGSLNVGDFTRSAAIAAAAKEAKLPPGEGKTINFVDLIQSLCDLRFAD
jgi:hypothetical protein